MTWCTIAIGLIVRLAIVMRSEVRLNEDVDAYLAIGRGLWETGVFAPVGAEGPTAFRPPLYPIVVAPAATESTWIVRGLINAVAGGMTLWLVWEIGSWLGIKTLYAVAACAASPLAIWYCGYSMTEVVCGLLLTAAAMMTLRTRRGTTGDAIAAGVLMGLASLCRPTCYLVAAGWVAWLLWRGERKRVAVLCVTATLTVLPWAVRNAAQFGRPMLTTSHGGYTLLLGNNPTFYDAVVGKPWGKTWSNESLTTWTSELEADLAADGVTGELARDAWMKDRAQQTIRERPQDFLAAAMIRVGRLWNVVPQGSAAEQLPRPVYLAIGVFYATCWVGAFVGAIRLWRQRPDVVLFLLAPVVLFTAVHLLYWANGRMRVPVEPFAFLLSATALGRRSTA